MSGKKKKGEGDAEVSDDEALLSFAKLTGVVAVLALLGLVGVAFVLCMLVGTIVVIFKHDWPWFRPAVELVQQGPFEPGLFYGCLGGLLLSFAIRLVRRTRLGLSNVGPVVALVFSVVGWVIQAHVVLGTAGYYIFRWFMGLGSVAVVAYAVFVFLAGLAPGVYAASTLTLYLVYNDPRLLTIGLLPAVIGELIDASFGEVRTKEEQLGASGQAPG